MHDLIIQLTKRDLPSNNNLNEFVCLGHFDYAKIENVLVNGVDRFKEFRSIQNLSKMHSESKDPEGMLRNYLINSGKFGTGGFEDAQPFSFLFMMTTAVNRKESESIHNNIEYFAGKYESELTRILNNGRSYSKTEGVRWEIYYPVSRGDIIILLRSRTFEKATEILSEFAKFSYVRYSYTIPMIAWSWIQNGEPRKERGECLKRSECRMRVRITAKDYAYIREMIEALQKQTGKLFADINDNIYASFGTDDVEFDFGEFNEEKLNAYLKFITNEENHKKYRDNAMFSAETDIPRKLVLKG